MENLLPLRGTKCNIRDAVTNGVRRSEIRNVKQTDTHNTNCWSFCFGSWFPFGSYKAINPSCPGGALISTDSFLKVLPCSNHQLETLSASCQLWGYLSQRDLGYPVPLSFYYSLCMLTPWVKVKFSIPVFELCDLHCATTLARDKPRLYYTPPTHVKSALLPPPPAFCFHPSMSCRDAPLEWYNFIHHAKVTYHLGPS